MLDLHTGEHGYTEVNRRRYLVRDAALYGTGQLPKFGEDLFRTTSRHLADPDRRGAADQPGGGHEILDETELPLRLTALTPCFRSEAGAAGKDTRGMLRQHQFDKVELVSIVHPERFGRRTRPHDRLRRGSAEAARPAYRVVVLSTGDLGFSAPQDLRHRGLAAGTGQTYREISAVRNCGDFQARRMNARFRPRDRRAPSSCIR